MEKKIAPDAIYFIWNNNFIHECKEWHRNKKNVCIPQKLFEQGRHDVWVLSSQRHGHRRVVQAAELLHFTLHTTQPVDALALAACKWQDTHCTKTMETTLMTIQMWSTVFMKMSRLHTVFLNIVNTLPDEDWQPHAVMTGATLHRHQQRYSKNNASTFKVISKCTHGITHHRTNKK